MSPTLAWALVSTRLPSQGNNSAPIVAETTTAAADKLRESANLAMDRYADGDESAFSELYDVLAPRLYRYLLRQTREAAGAEDLLQQTFLKLHASRARFLRGGDVLPWAFAIARRLFIDGYRRHQRAAARSDAPPPSEPSVEGAEQLLQAKRAALELDRELQRLPEAQRVVFELMRQDGLSLREVAEVLGTTTNAVKLRAHRAHVALRLALHDDADRFGE